MFTQRFRWSLEENALSRALAAARAGGRRVLDLMESNPTRAGLPYAEAEVRAALGQAGVLRYAPEPRGMREAREAVAGYYRERGVAGATAEAVHVAASTSELYGWLFKLLADPGDGVLVPRPSYPLLEFLGSLECLEVGSYGLEFVAGSGWHVDEHALERAVTGRTRAVVAVSPNNPTGSCVGAGGLAVLNRVCARHGVVLIVDEVFLDFPAAGVGALGSVAGNEGVLTFALGGLSKAACLPQVKLGWVYTSGPEGLRREAMTRLDFIAEKYLSAGTPEQLAAGRLLAGAGALREAVCGRLDRNERVLREAVVGMPWLEVLPREGGWYAVLRAPRRFGEERVALELLEDAGVHVHPGFFYDFEVPGHFVLSLLTPPEVWDAGVPELLARLRD